MRPSLSKAAIAVVGPAEQGTDFVGGMPAGPSVPREVPGVLEPLRRFPKTMAAKQESGMAAAMSENARETVSQLERKFGSFLSGFVHELKKAGLADIVRRQVHAKRPSVVQGSGITREKLRSPVEPR